jgi:hypothetical protein
VMPKATATSDFWNSRPMSVRQKTTRKKSKASSVHPANPTRKAELRSLGLRSVGRAAVEDILKDSADFKWAGWRAGNRCPRTNKNCTADEERIADGDIITFSVRPDAAKISDFLVKLTGN